MSSKRKAPEASGAAGKRRAVDDVEPDAADDQRYVVEGSPF